MQLHKELSATISMYPGTCLVSDPCMALRDAKSFVPETNETLLLLLGDSVLLQLNPGNSTASGWGSPAYAWVDENQVGSKA